MKLRPRQLFLIDGLGALVSAVMLGIVLPTYEAFFGMPTQVLYMLALIAGLLFLYSSSRYITNSGQWRSSMRVIGIANLMYCFVTLGLVIFYYQILTVFGVAYFLSEVVIILVLVRAELKTAFQPVD